MKFENMIKKKKGNEKIVMLTAYDYQISRILDRAPVDLILIGDSLGMVFQGWEDTKKVTMNDMLYHTKAVARGTHSKPIIADMPINSCKTFKDAEKNAQLFIQAGAHGIKIEGNKFDIISTLVESNIPVMGHIGLLPQTAEVYKVQGKNSCFI